jgi:UPF0755 protein
VSSKPAKNAKSETGAGKARQSLFSERTGRTTAVQTRSPSEVVEPLRGPKRPAGRRQRAEPRRLGPVLRLLNGALTMLLLALLVAGGGALYLSTAIEARGPSTQNKIIVIPRGEETQSIADRLEKEGVVPSRNMFVAAVHWLRLTSPKGAQLKAGDYEIKQGASIRSIIETLAEGRTVMTKVTVPEGLTSHQIVERLKADQSLTGDITVVPAEGTLLPETYAVSRGAPRQSVIDQMQAAQKKLIETAWAERQEGLPVKSPQEAIILASIVERETGRNDERDRVAAVFVNRLRQNMKLQSDPTILYGLSQGKVAWGKPILRSEIRSNTAHNTYVIPALPPTPICNPGRAAIEATLRPAASRELFFVADGKGGHTFAETLKDHNANAARWQQIEKERAARAGAAAVPAVGGGTGAAEAATEPAVQPAGQPAAAQPAAQPAAGQKAPAKKTKP